MIKTKKTFQLFFCSDFIRSNISPSGQQIRLRVRGWRIKLRHEVSELFSVPMYISFTTKRFFHLKVGQQKCPQNFVDGGLPYGHNAEKTKSLIRRLKIIFWHQKLVTVSFWGEKTKGKSDLEYFEDPDGFVASLNSKKQKQPTEVTRKKSCSQKFRKIHRKTPHALAQLFSSEFCEISKNTFFRENLWATASEKASK